MRLIGMSQTAQPPLTTRARCLAISSLILTGLSISLVTIEVAVRWVHPQPLKVSVPAILDEELIYHLPPNAKGTDVKEEFAVTIETNSEGFRDREYARPKPVGVRRVLVLGDSMTFADGVEATETYPKLLERALGDISRTPPEIVNAAIRGYGTDQELLLFRRLMPRYHPDVVLLAFYLGNDLDDNLDGHLFEVEGEDPGKLVRVPLSEESSPKYRYYKHQSAIQTFPMYQTLIAHSHLVNLLRRWWAATEFQRAFTSSNGVDASREDQAWRLTRQLLMHWHQAARQNHIRAVLLLIPAVGQITQNDPIDDLRAHRVKTLASELRIPLIDPLPALREAARSSDVYYPKDRHLTPAGHQVLAQVLLQNLGAFGIP